MRSGMPPGISVLNGEGGFNAGKSAPGDVRESTSSIESADRLTEMARICLEAL